MDPPVTTAPKLTGRAFRTVDKLSLPVGKGGLVIDMKFETDTVLKLNITSDWNWNGATLPTLPAKDFGNLKEKWEATQKVFQKQRNLPEPVDICDEPDGMVFNYKIEPTQTEGVYAVLLEYNPGDDCMPSYEWLRQTNLKVSPNFDVNTDEIYVAVKVSVFSQNGVLKSVS